MTTFSYTAISKDGGRTSGTLSAESRSAAISQVVQNGLHPLSITHSVDRAAASAKAAAAAKGKVSQRAVEAFTRELANLLAGGVPLARSLSLLKREASNPAARHLWGEIHDSVVGGTSLADSMAKWPRTFSSVYVAMVRAGEAGGFLDVVLGQIADFRSREQDLKGKVKAAMIYPAVLSGLAVCVLIFLLTWFIPQFAPMFADFGGKLPWLTQMIIAMSHGVRTYGVFIAVAIVVAIVLLRRANKTPEGKRRIEQAILAVPVLGRVITQFALVRFSRMLGTLIGAGVPLVASLRVAREAIGNQTLADTVTRGIEQVQQGSPLSRSLSEGGQLFPPSVVETLTIAEETGRLDKELVRIAASYESDLDRHLRTLVSLLEPLILFVMAGLIGTLVIGMLLPIFSFEELMR